MYENRGFQPLSSTDFLRRLLTHFALSAGMLVFSILLGGMGPVTMPLTTAGKLFAGCYALYSGLLFIVTAAIMVTPVAHRLLHRFHWEADE